jgi:hypothetical protein
MAFCFMVLFNETLSCFWTKHQILPTNKRRTSDLAFHHSSFFGASIKDTFNNQSQETFKIPSMNDSASFQRIHNEQRKSNDKEEYM